MNVDRFITGQTKQSVCWLWGLLAATGWLRMTRAQPRHYVVTLPWPSCRTWPTGFAMPWRWTLREGGG